MKGTGRPRSSTRRDKAVTIFQESVSPKRTQFYFCPFLRTSSSTQNNLRPSLSRRKQGRPAHCIGAPAASEPPLWARPDGGGETPSHSNRVQCRTAPSGPHRWELDETQGTCARSHGVDGDLGQPVRAPHGKGHRSPQVRSAQLAPRSAGTPRTRQGP